jgi:SAM-dependent methyltransferase
VSLAAIPDSDHESAGAEEGGTVPHAIVSDSFYAGILALIDAAIATVEPADLPRLLEPLPLDVFGLLLLDPPQEYPAIRAAMPSMPSDKLQEEWVGASGATLLSQSVAFVKSVVAHYREHGRTSLAASKVLDYGCGWGRLLRLFYKYVPIPQLHGVDAWPEILDTARQLGVRGHLAAIDQYPTRLPFDTTFDLIFAFSIFTHLSERAHASALAVCRNQLAEGGLLIATVRPEEFWRYIAPANLNDLVAAHRERGFAFLPHQRPAIDGDIPYGDTSISRSYIETRWAGFKLIATDYNLIDSMQLILVLRKR